MSACDNTLSAGDQVYHPRFGFGTVSGFAHHDPSYPNRDAANPNDYVRPNQTPGLAQDYYDIRLTQGGTLLVPLNRAQSVGLRRLIVGMEAVEACLCSPAQVLPENNRQRATALREREQATEPTALIQAVRDLLAWRGVRKLAPSEKAWLDKSYECLSTEVSLVDHITMPQARAAVQGAVSRSFLV